MATAQYLTLWTAALACAFLVGLATHYIHAHFQPYPDKILDGDGLGGRVLNEVISPKYVFWGEYDEGGWWEFYSLRNLLTHAIVPVLVVLITGAAFWSDRESVVQDACRSAASMGLHPRLCGSDERPA